MRADVGIGPYEVLFNKALNYNLHINQLLHKGVSS